MPAALGSARRPGVFGLAALGPCLARATAVGSVSRRTLPALPSRRIRLSRAAAGRRRQRLPGWSAVRYIVDIASPLVTRRARCHRPRDRHSPLLANLRGRSPRRASFGSRNRLPTSDPPLGSGTPPSCIERRDDDVLQRSPPRDFQRPAFAVCEISDTFAV